MSELTFGVTYGDVIVEALSRYPNREAFVDGDRRLTYADAADMVSRIRQVLAAHGVGYRGAVAALSPNVPETWMVQAAAYLLGATYSGLHPLGSAEDHAYLCDDADVDVLVVHPELAEMGAAVMDRAAGVRRVLTLGPADLGEDLMASCARTSARPLDRGPAREEDTAWLQYAGNITGRPKGVMIPHRAMVQQVQSLTASAGLPETPRYLASSPITHAAVGPIVPTLARGGTVVLQRSFDPDAWLRTVQDERINYAFTVPTMLYSLLDHASAQKFDLSSLKTVIYGAAPMSPARIAEAQDALGPVLLQVYGQTECVSFVTSLRKDEHDPERRPHLLSSCGRPVLGVRVELLDCNNRPVADGEVGEICVRGRGVMSGYRNLPEQTEETLRGDWLHTGELARRDEDGFFYIVDRTKDVIITGGFNVYPREIEDVLAGDPSVSTVAVIGVPDDKWGEAVTAFVAPQHGAQINTAELGALVRAKKGRHQVPKHIELVDSLPTTANGEVDKEAIRQRYWSDQERRVH